MLNNVGSGVAHQTQRTTEGAGLAGFGAASKGATGLKTGLKQPDGLLGTPATNQIILSLHFSRGSSIRESNYNCRSTDLREIIGARIHGAM